MFPSEFVVFLFVCLIVSIMKVNGRMQHWSGKNACGSESGGGCSFYISTFFNIARLDIDFHQYPGE